MDWPQPAADVRQGAALRRPPEGPAGGAAGGCAGRGARGRMGGCCTRDEDATSGYPQSPLLRQSRMSSSSSNSASGASTGLAAKLVTPRVLKDEEAANCFNCNLVFDVLNRRHHCRRCKNIFCDDCTSQRARVAVNEGTRGPYGSPTGPGGLERVCDRCFAEVRAENIFVTETLPRLREGGKLVKKSLLRGQRIIFMKTSPDLTALQFTDEQKTRGVTGAVREADRIERVIPFMEILSVAASADSDVGFDIHTRSNVHHFDAPTPRERSQWISAINDAVKKAQNPSLKDKVQRERGERRADAMRSREATQGGTATGIARRKEQRKKQREELSARYGVCTPKYDAS